MARLAAHMIFCVRATQALGLRPKPRQTATDWIRHQRLRLLPGVREMKSGGRFAIHLANVAKSGWERRAVGVL